MRRFGLVGRFALTSLALVALLGAVLAWQLTGIVRNRALASAKQAALVATVVGIQPLIPRNELDSGRLPDITGADLDAALQAEVDGVEIARMRIWNQNDTVIYSNTPGIGISKRRDEAPSEELAEALAGTVAIEILSHSDERSKQALLRRHGTLLEVYVPIKYGDAEPSGAFELYLPYRPVQQAARHDAQHMLLLLLLGLAALWAGMFRIVVTASRRLRRQAEINAHQALHDALTELPNRELLRDRCGQAIRLADRELRPVSLLLIDLDHFKEVNDTLGHQHGDALLVQVGNRLRTTLRRSDTVARLGGDEFGVLLTGLTTQEAAASTAEKLLAALNAPFLIGDLELHVEASVGIAHYPEHGTTADDLLQRADVAMYVAKHSHAGYAVYNPQLDEHSTSRLALLGELRRAVEQEELVLHFQPKVALATGEVEGVEALVRWQHPDRGLLPPSEFVPFAERTGLIGPVTDWVLRQALTQCRQWRADDLDLVVGVNLSARSLLDPTLAGYIGGLLIEYGVPPQRLELEITESTLMEDPPRALIVLTELHDMGVRLAIDDFGTGYSSLAYLKELPVDSLKIDRSFILQLREDERDAVIVRSTIELGRNLGLEVVAEGVESEEIRVALYALGCETAQGFHWSRPRPAGELLGWLTGRSVPVPR